MALWCFYFLECQNSLKSTWKLNVSIELERYYIKKRRVVSVLHGGLKFFLRWLTNFSQTIIFSFCNMEKVFTTFAVSGKKLSITTQDIKDQYTATKRSLLCQSKFIWYYCSGSSSSSQSGSSSSSGSSSRSSSRSSYSSSSGSSSSSSSSSDRGGGRRENTFFITLTYLIQLIWNWKLPSQFF